jgi:probable HAF family extracellular repeat protein
VNAAVRSDHEIFDLVGLSVSRTGDAVGSSDSIAYDVNNHGEVVGYMPSGAGYHAFLYSGSALTDIGTLGGAGSFAYSLNDSGTVVGDYALEDGIHAFMYANGSMTALSIAGYSEATAINSAGIITGTGSYLDSEGFCQPHVYTYTNGVVTDLGGLPNGYGTQRHQRPWSPGCQAANGINEQQQIAGPACRAGICYAVRLDLASQVPEPGAGALLGAGLMLLVGYAKRRNQCVSLRQRGYTLGHVT